MAKYLLTEAAYIHGIYYTAGTEVDFPNDLPSAMNWHPLDDDARKNVAEMNKKRAARGLDMQKLVSLPDYLKRLEAAGYTVTKNEDGTPSVSTEGTGGNEALVQDETGAVKKTKVSAPK